MWRVAIALVVAGIAGAVFGGHKLMVAMRNSSPVQMKYADWCASQPDAEWLELSEVHIDWSASVRIDTEHTRRGRTTSTTKEYYVACWASDEDTNPVRAFVKVDDKEKQQLMEQCWNHEHDPDWLIANASRVYEVCTMRGLMQTGLDLSSEDERLLRGLGHVDQNFKIIELNKEPQGGFGAILLVAGLAGVGAGLGVFVLGRKKKPAPLPYPTGQGRMPPPGAMPPAAPDAMSGGPRMPVGGPRPPQAGPRPPPPRPPQAH